MKFTIHTSALAIVLSLVATASVGLASRVPAGTPPAVTVDDPDPADCPFCGGNPALHVRRMVDLERRHMAILAALLR